MSYCRYQTEILREAEINAKIKIKSFSRKYCNVLGLTQTDPVKKHTHTPLYHNIDDLNQDKIQTIFNLAQIKSQYEASTNTSQSLI